MQPTEAEQDTNLIILQWQLGFKYPPMSHLFVQGAVDRKMEALPQTWFSRSKNVYCLQIYKHCRQPVIPRVLSNVLSKLRARTTFRSARTAFTYWPMLSIGHECYCSRGRPMRAWQNKIRGNIGLKPYNRTTEGKVRWGKEVARRAESTQRAAGGDWVLWGWGWADWTTSRTPMPPW